MTKIIAQVRDRTNGNPAVGEDVVFNDAANTTLATVATGADGSATYTADGNPAGQITWQATVSGETRKAGSRAQRQIGPFFEAELAKSLKAVVADGYSLGDGSMCAVIPGSGRQVTVGTGCIWVLGVPFHFYNATNLASAANATGSTRLDRVVLRCNFDQSSTSYGQGILTYVTGTTVLPALNTNENGTYDYLLANVTSANGFSSYTSGNIADQRTIAGTKSVTASALPSGIDAAKIGNGVVSSLEFQTLDGIGTGQTIETRLGLKANLASPTFTGTPTIPGFTNTGNITTDGKTVTPANLGMLMNASSELQSQINGKAASVHTHDDRYYTESETNSLLSGKSDTSHIHDDRYYTESETNSLLAAKAPTASPAFTGTATTVNLTASGNAALANLSVGTSIAIPDASISIAKTSGLQSALDSKAASSALSSYAPLNNPTFTDDVTVTNDFTAGNSEDDVHSFRGSIYSFGSSPGIGPGVGAGTGSSISLTGTDVAGVINLTTGTSPATGTVCTVTFNATKPGGKDYVAIITPANINAANQYASVRTNRASGSFTIVSHTALSASQSFQWNYLIVEFEP